MMHRSSPPPRWIRPVFSTASAFVGFGLATSALIAACNDLGDASGRSPSSSGGDTTSDTTGGGSTTTTTSGGGTSVSTSTSATGSSVTTSSGPTGGGNTTGAASTGVSGATNASGVTTSTTGRASTTGDTTTGATASTSASTGSVTSSSTTGGPTTSSSTSAGGSDGGASGGSDGATPVTGFFHDDFEATTNMAGKQPTGWGNFIAWIQDNTMNPTSTEAAVIDTTRAHSGKFSVHIKGGGNPAQIQRALPAGTNKVYVRAWIYFTRQLGMNPGANHETLIALRGDPKSANTEDRFGEIKGVIGTNDVPSDNIAPKMDMWGKGPVVAPNKWACIEVAFLGDKTQNELDAWADGVLVHSITAPDQWQNGTMPMNWLSANFKYVALGWHSFSSVSTELWIDDVVFSSTPVGCN